MELEVGGFYVYKRSPQQAKISQRGATGGSLGARSLMNKLLQPPRWPRPRERQWDGEDQTQSRYI